MFAERLQYLHENGWIYIIQSCKSHFRIFLVTFNFLEVNMKASSGYLFKTYLISDCFSKNIFVSPAKRNIDLDFSSIVLESNYVDEP